MASFQRFASVISLASVSKLPSRHLSSVFRVTFCDQSFLRAEKSAAIFQRQSSSESHKNEQSSGSGGVKQFLTKAAIGGLAVGSLFAGTQYFINKNSEKAKSYTKQDGQEASAKDYAVTEDIPELKVARQIRNAADNTGIKFKLFQYQTCPFCCKTRAFLDYFGLNYDVIEVNSVTRTQLKWSEKYKKVPILIAELETGEKFQLVDSTAIVSAMFSFLFDRPKGGLEEILNCYPQINAENENKTKKQMEIMNKYFLMFQNSNPGKDKKAITDERKWRKWVDDTLVHTLSPNVYRTPSEALQAFQWFDKAGDWPNHFKAWERYLVIYVGAAVMWIIGKRLKKRHNLKDDVREALYDEVNFWLKSIKTKGTPFMGGDQPDLSDLAVYGVLSAIEGCTAFEELLEKTKIATWFNAVKEACQNHSGQTIFA